jgi:xylan 1,4-beta-xylosidase
MGLSEPYFSKFFRKISGMTFSQYLNIVKMEHAIEMLQDNPSRLSVTEVSTQCGFNTIRHFNRIFKDITGISPRQLTSDYVLDIRPIRTMQDAFNPTLQNSELLQETV